LLVEAYLFSQFVNGIFNYSLAVSDSATKLVTVSLKHNVVFNASNPFDCRVPVFFVVLSYWTGQDQRIVNIGGTSEQYEYVGQYEQLNFTATCGPGSFVNISSVVMGNSTALYNFLISLPSTSTQLCSRCSLGSASTSDTVSFCPNCTAGTFANVSNTNCVPCPSGMWSRAGSHAACQACSTGAASTREGDHCVTLLFLNPPPSTVVSGILNKIPAVALVDVFDSAIVRRSGAIFIQLQCRLPGCQTDSSAEFDLITVSLSIVNGSSVATGTFLSESSQLKVGQGFVWRLYTLQEPGTLATSNINAPQYAYQVMFLGGAASIIAASPTQVASVGGTAVSITSVWKVNARLSDSFSNNSAYCIFDFIGNFSADASNTTNFSAPSLVRKERIRVIDASETVKICLTPAIPAFHYANLTIVLQDGRTSQAPFSLESVCHNNFYVNSSQCHPCPVSSAGRSSNILINAKDVELCVCDAGSYGTFGAFCRFCPRPSSLPSPPFICNSSNIRYPVVAPGYWVDYSLLQRCDPDSATCIAVTTCAFGARACPGGGEKLCTQTEEECYQGKGCSLCCPLYYNENNACFKCPDTTQTTSLLAAVAVVCIVLAVLMSSVSSPAFMQTSAYSFLLCCDVKSNYIVLMSFAVKYFVILSSFFQQVFSVKVRAQRIAKAKL
jgi:hypothetical protein